MMSARKLGPLLVLCLLSCLSLRTLAAVDDSRNLWSVDFGYWFSDSSPALAPDGTVYTGCLASKLFAVNSNGVVKWIFHTGSDIKSSPALAADGTILFGCRDRKLYALTPAGKLKWAFPTGAWVDSMRADRISCAHTSR